MNKRENLFSVQLTVYVADVWQMSSLVSSWWRPFFAERDACMHRSCQNFASSPKIGSMFLGLKMTHRFGFRGSVRTFFAICSAHNLNFFCRFLFRNLKLWCIPKMSCLGLKKNPSYAKISFNKFKYLKSVTQFCSLWIFKISSKGKVLHVTKSKNVNQYIVIQLLSKCWEYQCKVHWLWPDNGHA